MTLVVLFDTNVYISGIFWTGLPKRALHLARDRKVDAVTSEALLELHDVLTRAMSPFHLTSTQADRINTEIRKYTRVVTPVRRVQVCRDRKDNQVLEAALAGQVELIVTGDPDLKVLGEFEGIRIVDVRAFIQVVEQDQR